MLAFGFLALLHLLPPSSGVTLREPQLASSEKLVALAYGSGNGIYVVTSTDEGGSFSKPVKIFETEVLPLSRHRGPHLVVSQGVIVVTAVAGHTAVPGPHAHGLPADGDLLAWLSLDGGQTWSNGVRVNDVPAAPREGLHTLAADGRGNLFAAWLDQRDKGTRLYGAFSHDSGATWSSNVLIYESPDGTICQCCHPSAAFSAKGSLAVMWRNCLGGARDLYIIRSTGGRKFGKPEKLGNGTWNLNACPMDGGGLAIDGERAVTAWRRDEDIFLDEPGQPESRLAKGKDVALVASAGRVHVVWVDGTQLKSWSAGNITVLSDGAAFPTLTPLPGGEALAAWEENGGISLGRVP